MAINFGDSPFSNPDDLDLVSQATPTPTFQRRTLRRIQRNIRINLNAWITPANPQNSNWITYWEQIPLTLDMRRVIHFIHKDTVTEHKKRAVNRQAENSWYIVLPKQFMKIPDAATHAVFNFTEIPNKYYIRMEELT